MPGLKLTGELALDGTGFESGLHKAERLKESFAEGLRSFAIQAVGIATVEEALRKTVETAKELIDTSERLGIAPEQLQVLRQAALQSHVEMEKLALAFEKIDVARQKALGKNEASQDMRRVFRAAGIDETALRSQTAAQLFTGPMRQMALTQNPEQIGVIFRELGIRAFGGLIPVLKTNFDDLAAKMKKIGAIMDTETAVKLKTLADEASLLSKIVISNLAPVLVKLAELIFQFVGRLAAGITYIKTIMEGKASGEAYKPLGGVGAYLEYQSAKWNLEHNMYGKGFGKIPEEGRAKDQAIVDQYEKVLDKAALAFDATDEKWKTQLREIQSEMANLAAELRHPKPPDLSSPTLEPKLSKRALETPLDQFVRIGNFIGKGPVSLTTVNEKKVQLLQQIERNTKPRPQRQAAPPSFPNARPFIGEPNATEFPLI